MLILDQNTEKSEVRHLVKMPANYKLQADRDMVNIDVSDSNALTDDEIDKEVDNADVMAVDKCALVRGL